MVYVSPRPRVFSSKIYFKFIDTHIIITYDLIIHPYDTVPFFRSRLST